MKKNTAKLLNEFSEKLPLVFDVEYEYVPMFGWELKLTPLWTDSLDKEEIYYVEVPLFRAVEHKQQLKDAYKRGGIPEVQNYFSTILKKSNLESTLHKP